MRTLAAILSATLLLVGASGALAAEDGHTKSAARPQAKPKLSTTLRVGRLQAGTLRLGTLRGVMLAEGASGASDSVPAAGGKAAAKKAACDVIEFHATKTGSKSVDAKLDKWTSVLDQPPLSAFDTFKVTGSKSVTVLAGGTAKVTITASLNLLFKGVVTENDKERLQLEVTADDAKGQRVFRLTTAKESGASLIVTAGKSGDANVFFVATCSAQ